MPSSSRSIVPVMVKATKAIVLPEMEGLYPTPRMTV
jgi:hypothetical protein